MSSGQEQLSNLTELAQCYVGCYEPQSKQGFGSREVPLFLLETELSSFLTSID